LEAANLISENIRDKLIPVEESKISRIPANIIKRFKVRGHGLWREFFTANAFNNQLEKITASKSPVIHFGITNRYIKIRPSQNIFECVDASLESLRSPLWYNIINTKCLVNCQTNRIKNEFEKIWKLRECRINVPPNCFAKQVIPNKNVKRNPKKIIFVGRFIKDKSPLVFIEALNILRRKNVLFTASLLGEGPLEKKIKNKVKEYKLEKIVSIEFVKSLDEALLSSSIYVSLQTGDNYPSQALLEAMSAGCAILASDVGETHRLIDLSNGILVPIDSYKIAESLLLMLSNPEMTGALGQESIKKISAKFTADDYCEHLERIYHSEINLVNNR
jgi:glycosyltransferase involved in cell wall biosynthesis